MNAARCGHRFRAARWLVAAASTLCLVSTAAAQQNEPRVQWKYAPKDSQFEGVLVGELVMNGELLFVTSRRVNDVGESAVPAIKLP